MNPLMRAKVWDPIREAEPDEYEHRDPFGPCHFAAAKLAEQYADYDPKGQAAGIYASGRRIMVKYLNEEVYQFDVREERTFHAHLKNQ